MALTSEQRARAERIRAAMDIGVTKIRDDTAAINDAANMLRMWQPAAYQIGDVRMYQGIPYKCVQAHDATGNPGWTPDTVPALWMQYHGTSIETARPWIAPTGAHDVYKSGEHMIFTDNKVYKCISDTNFSPSEYAAAWEVQG